MARKLAHDFSLILGLSALLPFLIAAALLYSWNRADEQLNLVKHQEQYTRSQSSLRSALERLAVVTEMAAESREIIDYLMAPQASRIYTSNLVMGRLENIRKRADEIKAWYIFDQEKRLIFPESSQIEFPEHTGFLLAGDAVRLTAPIKIDDQYLSSGSSSVRGFISVAISHDGLLARTPGLAKVLAIQLICPKVRSPLK